MALYLYGGVYLDLDSNIDTELSSFIPPNKDFVFFYDEDKNLIQWCFMITPKHEIMKRIIVEMVTRINNGENNIFLATGPTLFTDVIFNFMHNTNIYDTGKHVTTNYREQYFKDNCDFMNGTIMDLLSCKDKFMERMDGYANNMLYNENHVKYIDTYRCETPNLYKKT